MYRIVSKQFLNPTVVKMDVEAPFVAKKALTGQFIILRVDENGERIPLTVADYDREKGTVTITYFTKDDLDRIYNVIAKPKNE